MRRILLVSPALLATGCASLPTSPSESVTAWVTVPQTASFTLPARDEALRRWMLPSSDPWSPYAKYTLLTALDAGPQPAELPDPWNIEDVQLAAYAGQMLGAYGVPPDVLFVVDLRGAASVAFGVALARSAPQHVSLVPTFNNWPGDDELVPAEETLAALVTMTPHPVADDRGPTTPVFLLDAWRLAYSDEEPSPETYDNRYILTPSDLPDAATLRARGIQRVVYVVADRDEALHEEDDVHFPFMAWEAEGITMAMVDLHRLEAPVVDDQWAELFVAYPLVVLPRVTLLDDPAFYLRARGGFGGVWARPSPLFHGGWAGGWYGHGGGG
jgi:hypothetical protein